MSTTVPVLHSTARAISHVEFMEALRATCPPRFPFARGLNSRHVGIALSGGVDSMALAFLCGRAKRIASNLKVADNPVSAFYAFTVDHGLRPESGDEARAVQATVKRAIGINCEALRIRWKEALPEGIDHPKDLPNFESVARRLRYRRIGAVMQLRKVGSLLLAHHEDDQYETVLMRLMAGHGVRGLRGMRASNDIPECYDLHGAYQSGFLDDQFGRRPFYSTYPSKAQRVQLRRELRAEVDDPEKLAQDLSEGVRAVAELAYLDDVFDSTVRSSRWAPPLAPIEVEDGGIQVYRPLLGFSKDRLVATCLENKIPWFEDATNSDPTLTPRNALRHMCRNHELPVALQKPAILQLARRCDARAAALDAEVDRLVRRSVVTGFRANVGTVVMQPPQFTLPRPYRKAQSSKAAYERRLRHYREVAGQLVRRMISLVSPDNTQLPAPIQQTWVVSRLFPSLALESETSGSEQPGKGEAAEAKAFSLSNVHFIPLRSDQGGSHASKSSSSSSSSGTPGLSPTRWYLTRTPYPSNSKLPSIDVYGLHVRSRWRKSPDKWKWSPWTAFTLFDGRFWVRVRTRLPGRLRVAPFAPEHAKPLREALADDGARAYLAAMLKRYAPGKVRYTLPAIYLVGAFDPVLDGEADGQYWGAKVGIEAETNARETEKRKVDGEPGATESQQRPAAGSDPAWKSQRSLPKYVRHHDPAAASEMMQLWLRDVNWERAWRQRGGSETGRLLALPTLGVQVPGTERWLQYQVRYRKVDAALLENSLAGEWEGSGSVLHRRRSAAAAGTAVRWNAQRRRRGYFRRRRKISRPGANILERLGV